jgi:hypothetical protein
MIMDGNRYKGKNTEVQERRNDASFCIFGQQHNIIQFLTTWLALLTNIWRLEKNKIDKRCPAK